MLDSLGIFIDGTKADWRGRKNKEGKMQATAIKRLYLRYQGQKEYIGGPGSESQNWWPERLWGKLTGAGRAARFRKIEIEVETWRPRVVDLHGWSRGGDDVYEACEFCRTLGVPVRFLLMIDPVPAFGLKGLARVVPYFPLQRLYKPPTNILTPSEAFPLGGGVAQVLAGEEHSRILRRACVQGAATYYVVGDHSDSGWRSLETDEFAVEQGALYGVSYAPLEAALRAAAVAAGTEL